MQVAEKAMEILRASQSTTEESKCMKDYCDAMVEIEKMKSELLSVKDYVYKSSKNYKIKEKRIKILSDAAHSFYDSYFNMVKYKELNAKANRDLLEKEMEFINLVAKATK
jgi:hypothetical protein